MAAFIHCVEKRNSRLRASEVADDFIVEDGDGEVRGLGEHTRLKLKKVILHGPL